MKNATNENKIDGTQKLPIPENFRIVAGDKSATSYWDEVPGADGYFIEYYKIEEPNKRIKYRYAQTTKKRILGFTNGQRYLATVCAFYTENGKECFGEKTDKVEFCPISTRLSAPNTICMKKGETKAIQWEYLNDRPIVDFLCRDKNIVTVNDDGIITANESGIAIIELSLRNMPDGLDKENGSCSVKVYVDRQLNHIEQSRDIHIMLTGDLMCSVSTQLRTKKNGYDFSRIFSSSVIKTLTQADLAVGVLETMCDDQSVYESEAYRLPTGSANNNSPSTFISACRGAGFDALITANNHNADCGIEGLDRTIAKIEENGLIHIGSRGDNPVSVDIRGKKICFIALSAITNGIDGITPNKSEDLARFSEEHYLKLLNEAKLEQSDYIIVVMHWGRMNSASVTDRQKAMAKFLADNGADLIVGSEPHVLQSMSVITNSHGKSVPCFYSLGNFYSAMTEMYENTLGGIVDVTISNEDNTLSTNFIPTLCYLREKLTVVDCVEPVKSDLHKKAKEFLNENLNLGLNKKSQIFLQGSLFLKNIEKYIGKPLDKSGLVISPLTIFSDNGAVLDENSKNYDFSKKYEALLKENKKSLFVFDLYNAAAISIYEYHKDGKVLYFTGSNSFLKSEFYKTHTEELVKINVSENTFLWEKLLDNYLDTLLKVLDKNNIVLIRTKLPAMGVKRTELRNCNSKDKLNRLLCSMEEYVIKKIDPCVIDITQYYFRNLDSIYQSLFEDCYYKHLANIIAKKSSHVDSRFYHDELDYDIWMERVIKYYDNMQARSYQKYLLNDTDAADIIISNSSKNFVAIHQKQLIELKKNFVALEYVKSYFGKAYEELSQAAETIVAIKNNLIPEDKHKLDVAFKYGFKICKELATLLSTYTGYHVANTNAKLIYSHMQDKEWLQNYYDSHPLYEIDIWGSCISRGMVSEQPESIVVANYIFKQPHILYDYVPKTVINTDYGVDVFGGNKWRMRTIVGSINHNGKTIIEKSTSRYIVVDLYDLICEMSEYKGELLEVDDYIKRTTFYKNIKKECEHTFLYKEMSTEEAEKSMVHFGKFLKDKYGDNIVLVIADLKNTYLDMDNELRPLGEAEEEFQAKKAFIARMEEVFINATDCKVIDESRRYNASDMFPLGGAHIVHYESDFYKDSCKKLLSIFSELELA